MPRTGTVLEIGSGTGQHAVFFAGRLPGLVWQASDRQENLEGLEARLAAEGGKNILPPLKLDVIHDNWPDTRFHAAFSANTAHIMHWEAVVAMFAGVAASLLSGSRFCLYGPFNVNARFTSQSNANFDAHLRAEDPKMGIRDLADVENLAVLHNMTFEEKLAMPANNFVLVFKKL